MNKAAIYSTIFTVVLLLGLWAFVTSREEAKDECEAVVAIKTLTVCADVADTHNERVQGLSGREILGESQAMLFEFGEPGEYGIWMKDMNFSIDVLWLDEALEVVHIVERMSPESYPRSYRTPTPARYVLEINAGLVEKNAIAIGDKAAIK